VARPEVIQTKVNGFKFTAIHIACYDIYISESWECGTVFGVLWRITREFVRFESVKFIWKKL